MDKKTIIGGGRVILPSGIRDDVSLIVSGSKIEAVIPASQAGKPDIDAGGRYISPGFIDIHVHGGGGQDFMDGTLDAFLGAARIHAEHGTTCMTPTTLTCSDEELQNTFRIYKQAVEVNTEGAEFAGLHLEGPFFSAQMAGAQDPQYLKLPTPDNYLPVLDGFDDIVRVSVAPELEGALELGKELRRRGIVASIAHTAATSEQCEAAFEVGYSLMTHFYCAMSTVVRRNAFRYAGAVEAGYLHDEVDVEIIADGVHLPGSLLRLIYKIKGPERITLCTDAMRGAGMPDGHYLLGSLKRGQDVIVEDGVAKLPDRSTFAGSVATADRLVRTMHALSGATLEESVAMMTRNPARILGLEGRKGSLASGYDADIVIFDDDIKVYKTLIGGRLIYNGN